MADTNKNEKDKEKTKKTFSKDFKTELKRVTWPTPKQLLTNTIGVVVITIIVAIIVFVLDLAFESINKYGINNLKEIVVAQTEEKTQSEENGSEEENSIESSENNETATVEAEVESNSDEPVNVTEESNDTTEQ